MKHMRKYISCLLVLVMMFVLGISVSADSVNAGSITIENATKGITYEAYKLFDATYDGEAVAYKVAAGKKDLLSTEVFEISSIADSEGNYTFGVKDGVTDDVVTAWIKANYSSFAELAISGNWSDGSTYVFSDLDFGYYYITSSLGSVVSIDSAVPNATVKDKNNSMPEVTGKLIVGENTTIYSEGKTENEASVGTIEKFEISFQAVNWITTTDENGVVNSIQAQTYTVIDTPDGYDIDADSVHVNVTDNGTEKEITSTAKISKSETGVVEIEIPWVDASKNSLYQPKTAGAGENQTAHIPVKIIYDAVVLKEAATHAVSNEAACLYNIHMKFGSKRTTTYTYKFQLNKSDELYKALNGAKFELYKDSVSDANKVKFSVEGNVYTVDGNGTVTEIDLTSGSTALILGLDKTDYVLRETKVPAGYNMADDQKIAKESLVRVDGTITDVENAVEGDSGVVTVVNKKGTELPSTGGTGTKIFYVVGTVLILGAVAALVTRKRMSKSDK